MEGRCCSRHPTAGLQQAKTCGRPGNRGRRTSPDVSREISTKRAAAPRPATWRALLPASGRTPPHRVPVREDARTASANWGGVTHTPCFTGVIGSREHVPGAGGGSAVLPAQRNARHPTGSGHDGADGVGNGKVTASSDFERGARDVSRETRIACEPRRYGRRSELRTAARGTALTLPDRYTKMCDRYRRLVVTASSIRPAHANSLDVARETSRDVTGCLHSWRGEHRHRLGVAIKHLSSHDEAGEKPSAVPRMRNGSAVLESVDGCAEDAGDF